MKASAENECMIASALVEATRETFNKLKIKSGVSSPLYFFSIYKTDSEGSKEERAGVFASIEQCTELERQAHYMGMPTSKCVEWRSRVKPMGDVR
jgi:5,10-methylenetetrahydrofolate reductase